MKVRIAAAVAVVVALGIGALIWFQPQKLVIEQTVDETPPPVASSAATPAVLSRNAFVDHAHGTAGRAVVLRLEDGSRVVRFEDFSTSNGPDVVVWLSSAPPDAEGRAFAARFLDLGPLKGNRGDQNYSIPADADLSRYKSVVIWCRRFTVPFGAAAI